MDLAEHPLSGIEEENAVKIAVAYDIALAVLARDERMPSPCVRMSMLRAMLKEAMATGFDRERLALAAVAAARGAGP